VGRVVNVKKVGRPVRGRAPGLSVQLYDGTGYIPATVWGRGWLLNQLVRMPGSSSRARCSAGTDCSLRPRTWSSSMTRRRVGETAHAGRLSRSTRPTRA
jgi:hypothetical protein